MKKLLLPLWMLIALNLYAQDGSLFKEDITDLASRNNLFAFEYYHYLSKKDSRNLFFSPFSIVTTMATLYAGSKGNTAEELAGVFHFSQDVNQQNLDFLQLLNHYKSLNSSVLQLKMLHNFWVQSEYIFQEDYLKSISRHYQAYVKNLDFRLKPEESRKIINQEVKQQSQNMIPELLPQGFITDRSRMIVTNLIFLDALWQNPFDPLYNNKGVFYSGNSEIDGVDYMTSKNVLVNYYENNEYQLLEMPYQGANLGMLLILPKQKDGIQRMSLDAEFYAEKSTISKQQEDSLLFEEINQDSVFFYHKVDIIFPKFKFNSTLNLKEDLIALGLGNSFQEAADFSEITGKNDLYLGEALHQTVVEVNETGTKAIAATAIGSVEKGITKPKVFKADHPFVFIIRDRSNGVILFMGRVMNPLEK
ncbi:MAG: serpin family protein [Microscillaceae bacterium]|nr:serpin family protein [Microscillaceae bacterium]